MKCFGFLTFFADFLYLTLTDNYSVICLGTMILDTIFGLVRQFTKIPTTTKNKIYYFWKWSKNRFEKHNFCRFNVFYVSLQLTIIQSFA